MNSSKFLLLILFLLSLLFVFSCEQKDRVYPFPDGDPVPSPSPLPIEVKKFITDSDNNIQYYDNSPDHIRPNGYTSWKWGNYYDAEMTRFETDIFKVSGNRDYGYGVIFCVQGDTNPLDTTDDAGQNCLALMINTYGQYLIAKMVNNRFVYPLIKDKTFSKSLAQGLNAPNKITIDYLGILSSKKTFQVVFNDCTADKVIFEYVKKAGEPDFEMCGRYGFIATVAPKGKEHIPYVPVDIRFKQLIPANLLLPIPTKSLFNINDNTIEIEGVLE